MLLRPLAGVLLAFVLAPSAANRPGGFSSAATPGSAPVAPAARSRRTGGTAGGECVHAISYGTRDPRIGIVQA